MGVIYENLFEIDPTYTGGASRARMLADAIANCGAVSRGEFRLSGGAQTDWYFDGRLLMTDPITGTLVGRHFATLLLSFGDVGRFIYAVGGPAMGALPLTMSIIGASVNALIDFDDASGKRIDRPPLFGFWVRPDAKAHGATAGNLIEGAFPKDPNLPVAIVDDVVTTGASILRAIDAVEARGNPIEAVMCILDRGGGGAERLKGRGYDLRPMMRALPQAQADFENADMNTARRIVKRALGLACESPCEAFVEAVMSVDMPRTLSLNDLYEIWTDMGYIWDAPATYCPAAVSVFCAGENSSEGDA